MEVVCTTNGCEFSGQFWNAALTQMRTLRRFEVDDAVGL